MKEEIEMGEYARTQNGFIFKVVGKEYYKDYEDEWLQGELLLSGDWKEHVIKHSKSLIDLIEVGDIVRGKDNHLFEVYAVGSDSVYINNLEEFIHIEDIKSIATHEQMKEMEYKV